MATLKELINSAPSGVKTTLVMVMDETITDNEYAVVANDKDLVIDLNGHKIIQDVASAAASYIINNLGTLKIIDSSNNQSGAFILNSAPTATAGYSNDVISNKGSLEIAAGLFENKSSATDGAFVIETINNFQNTNLKITGGNFISSGTTQNSGNIKQYVMAGTSNNVVIEGGEFVCVASPQLHSKLESTTSGSSSFEIEGGTFSSTGSTILFLNSDLPNSNASNLLKIKAGKFNYPSTSTLYSCDSTISTAPEKFISGGTFLGNTTSVSANLADDTTLDISTGIVMVNVDNNKFLSGEGLKLLWEKTKALSGVEAGDAISVNNKKVNVKYDNSTITLDENGNLKAIAGGDPSAGFLSFWNCKTGLPIDFPRATPYTYKKGDYYRVLTVSDHNYRHNVIITNSSTSATTANIAFSLVNPNEGTIRYNSAAGSALKNAGYTESSPLTATGSYDTTTVTGVCGEQISGTYKVGLIKSDGTLITYLEEDDVIVTDTVQDVGYINYHPSGTEYTGAASTASILSKLSIQDVFVYIGNGSWHHIPYTTSYYSGDAININSDDNRINVLYDNNTIKLNDSGKLCANSTFIAEYNVTTLDEILDAYNSGENPSILCKVSTGEYDGYIQLNSISATDAQFMLTTASTSATIICDASGWEMINEQSYVKIDDVTDNLTSTYINKPLSANQGKILNETKVDKPIEPISGQGVNVPYYFDVTYGEDKATVKDYTINLLDKSEAPKTWDLDINSATQTTAGLMSKADKVKLDNMSNPAGFLAFWDCSTGLAENFTRTLPYVYQSGDYFRVNKIAVSGSTNYKPDGASYSGASTTQETSTVHVGDIYIYHYDTATSTGSWTLKQDAQDEVYIGSTEPPAGMYKIWINDDEQEAYFDNKTIIKNATTNKIETAAGGWADSATTVAYEIVPSDGQDFTKYPDGTPAATVYQIRDLTIDLLSLVGKNNFNVVMAGEILNWDFTHSSHIDFFDFNTTFTWDDTNKWWQAPGDPNGWTYVRIYSNEAFASTAASQWRRNKIQVMYTDSESSEEYAEVRYTITYNGPTVHQISRKFIPVSATLLGSPYATAARYITIGDKQYDLSDIFIAEYNSTSYLEILSAYNNGLNIFCKVTEIGSDAVIYAPLSVYITDTQFVFGSSAYNYKQYICAKLGTQGTTWTNSSAYYVMRSDIIDNVTTTTTNKVLSAKQGKVLNDKIASLESLGRYIALWDCVSHSPTSTLVPMPFPYRAGDYYRVSRVASATGETNYRPAGSQYDETTAAYAEELSTEVTSGDLYLYNTSGSWELLHFGNSSLVDFKLNGISQVSSDGTAYVDTDNKTIIRDETDNNKLKTVIGGYLEESAIKYLTEGEFSKIDETEFRFATFYDVSQVWEPENRTIYVSGDFIIGGTSYTFYESPMSLTYYAANKTWYGYLEYGGTRLATVRLIGSASTGYEPEYLQTMKVSTYSVIQTGDKCDLQTYYLEDEIHPIDSKFISIDNNTITLDSSDRLTAKQVAVVDNVTSTYTNKALSAKQGKVLADRISSVEQLGRYISLWSCVTGKPTAALSPLPYVYNVGDYYRVTAVTTTGTNNLRPSGSSYTGDPSTEVETGTVAVGDLYFYNGSVWESMHVGSTNIVDFQINDVSSVVDGVGKLTIVDNLTSTEASAALSANQGKVLNDKINGFLPTDGSGVMTGTLRVTTTSDAICAPLGRNDSNIRICGGDRYNNGACLYLYGKNSTGAFSLRAQNSTYTSTLSGQAGGSLKWNNKELATTTSGSVSGELSLSGGTSDSPGGTLQLMGPNSVTDRGNFAITASNGSQSATLRGTPTGGLTWNSQTIPVGECTKVKSKSGESTRDSLATLFTNLTGAIDIHEVIFTAAESPNGSSETVWTGHMIKWYTDWYSLEVHQTLQQNDTTTIPCRYFCSCNEAGGTTHWTSWQKVITDVGGTFNGSLIPSKGINIPAIKSDVDNNNLIFCGGTTWQNGGFLWLHGKSDGGGGFEVGCSDGTANHRLVGKLDGTLAWNNNNVITSAGGTFNGTIISSVDQALVKSTDNGALAIQGGSADSKGARLSLSGKNRTGGYAGMFTLRAYDGTNDKILTGKPDGTLTWNGNDISGTVKTLSPTSHSVVIHAYQIGKLVIVHGDGLLSTALVANDVLVSGLPKPNYNRVPVTFAYYNTYNKGTRLWLSQESNSGSLKADTEGVAADYIKFNFTYIAQ